MLTIALVFDIMDLSVGNIDILLKQFLTIAIVEIKEMERFKMKEKEKLIKETIRRFKEAK